MMNAAADLDWLRDVRRRHPLAVEVLWQQPKAVWDQRRALAACMQAPVIGIILGGERSGKTRAGLQWAACAGLGGDHPMARAWLDLNQLPEIPPGPADMFIAAKDSGKSLELHRRVFARWFPHGHWHNEQGKGGAQLDVEVPGYDRPATYFFRAVEQGPESFQGNTLRGVLIDEEPKGTDGRKVIEQAKTRVRDQRGLVLITMSPLLGLTHVHDDYVRDRKDAVVIAELDALDNPHLPHDLFVAAYASMDEVDVQRKRFGRFFAREGVVYNQWVEGDGSREGPGHLCKPFDIPKDWTRFRAADFGLVAPTCVLWGAVGDDETLYVYRELYVIGLTYEQVAEKIVELEQGEVVEQGWADPSAKDAIDTCGELDVYFDKANNDVKAGIDSMRNRMRVRADGRPRIKVFTTCVDFMREIRTYRWDEKRKDDVPVKANDHAMDTGRYLSTGVDDYYAR